ncbi:hypothetical protein Tco_1555704 [Tanacetum coccineum]
MVTPVEKRSSNKFCNFHNNKGHSTDECMQLKKQIEELVRAGKLSHLIKEIKQGRDQTKNGKKETPAKEKSLTEDPLQKFSTSTASTNSGRKLRARWSRNNVVNNRLSDKLYAESGQLRLLVTIGDVYHCTRAWMNFMIVRSMSPYNGIIGRSGIREIQAVPSTAHGMLKFSVDGGIVTIRSTILISSECVTVITSSKEIPKKTGVRHENFKVAIHLNFPDQEVAIG